MKNLKILLIIWAVLFLSSCSTKKKQNLSFPMSDECFSGNASSCIEQGLGEKDNTKSLELFKHACKLNSKVGCGLVFFLGDKTSKKAKDLFGQSCFLEKDKVGCGTLGFYALANNDEEKGLSLLKQACDMKHKYSCYQLMHHHIKLKNIPEIIKYADGLCTLKDGDTCLWLGNYYLRLKRKKEAKVVFEKACELKNALGCFRRGFHFINLKNAADTFLYLSKACQLNHARSCFYYADLMWETKKKLESYKFYQKSCNLKFANGCVGLGRYHSVSGDKNLAIKYYSRGCAFSDDPKNIERKSDILYNCFLAGQYASEYFNPKVSVEFFKRGCHYTYQSEEEKDFVMDSCSRLGLYDYDSVVLQKAVDHIQKRCEEGGTKKTSSRNCYNLSCLYSMTRKIEKSMYFMRKALEYGYNDWANLLTDFETINIRNMPGFKRLVDEFRK